MNYILDYQTVKSLFKAARGQKSPPPPPPPIFYFVKVEKRTAP